MLIPVKDILNQLWVIDDMPQEESVNRFANYVKMTRESKNLSRLELSHKTGLTLNYLLFLECKKIMPKDLTNDVRNQIELALGVSEEDFYCNKKTTFAV